MNIVFMGTPDFAVPTLAKLLVSDHTVSAVYTQPDKPQGRRQVLTAPPVKTLAEAHGIPVYQPQTLRDETEQQRLRALAPDVIVVVAYGKLLPKAVLEIPQHGCINVHGSLLPRWRGAAPIQWAVIAGDSTAGVTTMQMAEGLDTGDMLLRYETKIGPRETAGELFDRLAEQGAALLLQTLDTLPSIQPEKQNDAESCYASMLHKEMAEIDWSKTAREIDCLVRGLNPWPIALTTLAGEKIKIFSVSPCTGQGTAGQTLASDPAAGLVIACGDGALRVEELQSVGGKRLQTADWLRGHTVTKGTVFGK